jgi:hypothetical protein
MIDRIKEFLSNIFTRSELATLDPQQLGEIARDIGVSSGDLYRLDHSGAAPALMPRRLEHEGVDSAFVQAEWPSVWKDLQRSCSLCGSKDVCRNELVIAPEAQDWRRYCPNEHTIDALKTTNI